MCMQTGLGSGCAARIIHQARTKAGLSLRELGRRAGTSHATLIAYEAGTKVPGFDTFIRIIEACGFAVQASFVPRVRHRDGIARGDELIEVLRLAEQFPSKVARKMEYPSFPTESINARSA